MTKRERTRATGCERHPEVTSCPPCARCGAPQCCPKCCEEASAEVKEPTMTEFERAAEEFLDNHIPVQRHMELRPILIALLTSHARPAAGFIREATGPDRKVLGTLPVTADGCVLVPDRSGCPTIWNNDQHRKWAQLTRDDDGAWGGVFDKCWRFVEDCYSTREAAEAARLTPAAAQAERGEG